MTGVDVRPPRLRVADEGHLWELLEHAMEPLEAMVVHAELPVHQHRHAVRLGKPVDRLHLRGVAGNPEFLFRDHDGAARELPLDLLRRTVEVGHVVGPEAELAGMCLREVVAGVVAEGLRLQPVRDTVVGRGSRRRPAGGQQDGRGDAHRPLVRQQHGVGPAAVAEVLVDVYDGLSLRLHAECVGKRQSTGGSAGRGQEEPAGSESQVGRQPYGPALRARPRPIHHARHCVPNASLAAALLASAAAVTTRGQQDAPRRPWPPGVQPVSPESPALTPDQERATFHLAPGYRLELVASEPLVQDPVAIDWVAGRPPLGRRDAGLHARHRGDRRARARRPDRRAGRHATATAAWTGEPCLPTAWSSQEA